MDWETRIATATSRRALVAAGAGWVLGAAGLLLPAAGDEAEARGALGGAKGGRHGKDHRGRDKRRDKNKNDQTRDDERGQAREEGQNVLGVRVTFANLTSSQVNLQINEGGADGVYEDPNNFSLYPQQWGGPWQSSVELIDSEGGLANKVWFILTSQGHTLDVQVKNPWVGTPGIYITDQTTNTDVFNETFDVGRQVDSGLFLANRDADTTLYKEFRLSVRDFF